MQCPSRVAQTGNVLVTNINDGKVAARPRRCHVTAASHTQRGRGAQLSLLSSLSCLPHAQVTVYNPNDNNFKLYSELRVDTKTANNRASGNTVLSSDV